MSVLIAATAISAAIAVALLIAPGNGEVQTPFAWLALTFVTAWSYVVVGLMTWNRRPSNAVGPIIVAAGFAAFAWSLQAVYLPGIFVAGALGSHLMPVLLGNLLMVFPIGRFETKFQRNLVVLGYVEALLITVPALLVFDTSRRCGVCPENPFLVDPNDGLQQAITLLRLTVDGVLAIGLAVALTRRWYASVPTQRAVLAPVVWSGGVALVAFFVAFVSELSGVPEELLNASNLVALALSAIVAWAVAFGFARGRFTRAGAVNDLIATLTSDHHLDTDLRGALARGLQDPTLELAFWLPQQQRYVDSAGKVVVLPPAGLERRSHSVELNGELIAAIIYNDSTGEQSSLIRAAGGAAALMLENQRLEAELRAHVKELRSSRARLLEATDAERKRIERDLHDGAQQRLLSIALHLNLAGLKMEKDPTAAAELFEIAAADLTTVTEELRDLARGIHPAILTDRGLAGALTALADRTPIRIELISLPDGRLPATVESTAYFVVAEAAANVLRYADASCMTIQVIDHSDHISVEVTDDGVGGASFGSGTGLSGLRERISALEGQLQIVSPPGEGTIVRATLPTRPIESTPDEVAVVATSGVENVTPANSLDSSP